MKRSPEQAEHIRQNCISPWKKNGRAIHLDRIRWTRPKMTADQTRIYEKLLRLGIGRDAAVQEALAR